MSADRQNLVEWFARQGWRFTASTGGRTVVAHGTIASQPVVLTASAADEDEALRRLLGALAARSLASHPAAKVAAAA